MPYQLIVVQGRSATQIVKLGNGVTCVGRQHECQLRISSSQVSRRHCELFEKKGLLLVKDLGSSNGTFVNGDKVDGQRVIEPGDELVVGNVKFRVEKIEETALMPGSSPAPGGTKPADTAISEAIAIDDDSSVPKADDATQAISTKMSASPAKPAAKVGTKGSADKKDPSLGEDEVAEFLLNIELDDEDKL